MKRTSIALMLAAAACAAALGQSRQAVVRVTKFAASGVGDGEAAMFERLIVSYIVELKSFRVVDAQGQEAALSETEAALGSGQSAVTVAPLVADFIVGGSLGRIGELYVAALEITRVSSGEKLSVSDTALSIGDIVLRARDLTNSLFGKSPPPQAAAKSPADPKPDPKASAASQAPVTGAYAAASADPARAAPQIQDLAGSWRGDKGLETIRIFANGSGLAVLSGGGTMKLKVSIAGPTVTVEQDQPNDVAMYRAPSVTLETARAIARQARPMRWVFSLSADGMSLRGTKESVSISGTGAGVSVDNAYVRDASWSRISR